MIIIISFCYSLIGMSAQSLCVKGLILRLMIFDNSSSSVNRNEGQFFIIVAELLKSHLLLFLFAF